ncbi:cytochrome P450 [Collybia nuda]|uniref:Cytochrome P450 n=1 Tax=Collybia nuda TaxID=64659 RepID=A0A9P5XZ34_9AGAR|nr:cytochrome P450 [Collybia nuda]
MSVPPYLQDRLPLKAFVVISLFLIVRFLRLHQRVQAKINNIPGPKSKSWTGNFTLLHDAEKGWEFFEHIQANYGSMCRITTPTGCNDMLYVTDPLALLHIVRKDENLFDDPMEIHIMLQMVLGNRGLGATRGVEHHRQRKILNPMFSSSSLRHMVPIFYDVTHKFLESLQALCAEGSTEIDMSHWGTRVSLELVGQGAVGHSFDSLEVEGKSSLYGEDMKQGFVALSTSASRLGMKYLLPLVSSLRTPGFNKSLLNVIPSPTVGIIRKFIWDLDVTSRELFTMKKEKIIQGETALSGQVGKGKDLMTGLIRDYVLTDQECRIDEEEATSHVSEDAWTLLFAATDTSSSAILRTLLVLSEHPDIQERVRQEICAAKLESDGDLLYDKLLALPLLDAVYRETLRLYPPACYIDRVALEDTILPLAFPIVGRDGKRLNEIFVPKKTVLTLSIVGVNRSSAIWGRDASEWKPERWLGELPASVKDSRMPGIYSHMMTFMDGKRHCLRVSYFRHAEIVISELLCALRFSPSLNHGKISWPMGLTLSPFVDGKMSMPLQVSRV